MTNLIERADEIERLTGLFDKWHTIAAEQRIEIERLRAENARLRARGWADSVSRAGYGHD
jgi:predicted aminopeptidase